MEVLESKKAGYGKLIDYFQTRSVGPDEINDLLESSGSTPIRQKMKLKDIITRPQVGITDLSNVIVDLKELTGGLGKWSHEILEGAEIRMKYMGYLEREKNNAEKIKRLEALKIPDWIKYDELAGLTMEARQKLSKIRPLTISQASRIPGISPADINVLLVTIGR
jgi:tRNA uridine 5-carboxymethylaminomethyl modification enzyme